MSFGKIAEKAKIISAGNTQKFYSRENDGGMGRVRAGGPNFCDVWNSLSVSKIFLLYFVRINLNISFIINNTYEIL